MATDRPRKGLRTQLAIALLALCATAGCGSSASGPKELDMATVRHAIEHSIKQQRHLVSRVECPRKEPERVGLKFACIATTLSTKTPHHEIRTAFLVTERDDKGRITYIGE